MGQLGRFGPLLWILEGSVQDDRDPGLKKTLGLVKHLGVGLGRHLGRVEALVVGVADRGRLGQAGQSLANHVGADEKPTVSAGEPAAQGRLARAHEAVDHDQGRDGGALGVGVGQGEVAPGRLEVFGLGLAPHGLIVPSEAVDLAPNVGPVALVEVDQLGQFPVPGAGGVGLDQVAGEVGQAVEIQVHGQKSQISGHVGVAETLVELDAVEDDGLVFKTDVGQVQIAVALPDAALSYAAGEEIGPLLIETVGESHDFSKTLFREADALVGGGLGEVLVGVELDRLHPPQGVDLVAGGRLLIKRNQNLDQLLDHLLVQLSLLEDLRPHPVQVHLAHDHNVVHHLTLPAQGHPAAGIGDGLYLEVDRGGQAAI